MLFSNSGKLNVNDCSIYFFGTTTQVGILRTYLLATSALFTFMWKATIRAAQVEVGRHWDSIYPLVMTNSKLLKMAHRNSRFNTSYRWWFSIAILVYGRVNLMVKLRGCLPPPTHSLRESIWVLNQHPAWSVCQSRWRAGPFSTEKHGKRWGFKWNGDISGYYASWSTSQRVSCGFFF